MQNETGVKVSAQPVTAAVGSPLAKASSAALAATSAKLSAPRTPATPNINFYSPQVKILIVKYNYRYIFELILGRLGTLIQIKG